MKIEVVHHIVDPAFAPRDTSALETELQSMLAFLPSLETVTHRVRHADHYESVRALSVEVSVQAESEGAAQWFTFSRATEYAQKIGALPHFPSEFVGKKMARIVFLIREAHKNRTIAQWV